jgi:uncharacterized DUF497 family protein
MAILEFDEFDWDDQNAGHLERHQVTTAEAEEAILNRPVSLGSQLRNGEKRIAMVGQTDTGRVLVVVATMRDKKVRVVTAWPANKNYRGYFSSMRRSGNAGRIEEQDLRE